MVVQFPPAAPLMPFGRHRGTRIDRIPSCYLLWLLVGGPHLDRGLRDAVAAELAWRDYQADAATAAVNRYLFEQAVAAGEFVIDPATPVRSQALAWYLEWCRDWGEVPRVREITWAEIEQAVRDGRELPT